VHPKHDQSHWQDRRKIHIAKKINARIPINADHGRGSLFEQPSDGHLFIVGLVIVKWRVGAYAPGRGHVFAYVRFALLNPAPSPEATGI
jgi:hypothetical protein